MKQMFYTLAITFIMKGPWNTASICS